MKRPTILAVALVVSAVALVMWFASENAGNEQLSSAIALTPFPSQPAGDVSAAVRGDVVDNDSETPVQPASPQSASSNPQSPSANQTVVLFSRPDYGSPEYRNALTALDSYMAQNNVQNVASRQLTKRNQWAVDEFMGQLKSSPSGLSSAFQVSPDDVRACTVSSIERITPSITPDVPIPGQYRAEARCDESGDEVTIGIDRSLHGTIAITIRSRQGGVSIYSIDDSGYSIALQYHPIPPAMSPGGRPPFQL